MKKDVDTRNLVLLETPDGSYTFALPESNETYHSVFGAKTESEHIYIQNGLSLIAQQNIHVVEMGFGTGLNALLACRFAVLNGKNITYHTCEPFPIDANQLPVPKFIQNDKPLEDYWRQIHQAPWDELIPICPNFSIHKHPIAFEYYEPDMQSDIVFYDAFAPAVQPEMWQAQMFKLVFNYLKPGGLLVTYSCSGIAKRAIREAGFITKRIPGPPVKWHMLRATKPYTLEF